MPVCQSSLKDVARVGGFSSTADGCALYFLWHYSAGFVQFAEMSSFDLEGVSDEGMFLWTIGCSFS